MFMVIYRYMHPKGENYGYLEEVISIWHSETNAAAEVSRRHRNRVTGGSYSMVRITPSDEGDNW